MTTDKRAVIAFIAASIVNGTQSNNNIYDYSQNKYLFYNVMEMNRKRISVYDYGRNSYLQGSMSSIFDYGSNTYITLNINDNNINGFDYESGCYYGGHVSGRTVYLYDYETMKYYTFLL